MLFRAKQRNNIDILNRLGCLEIDYAKLQNDYMLLLNQNRELVETINYMNSQLRQLADCLQLEYVDKRYMSKRNRKNRKRKKVKNDYRLG